MKGGFILDRKDQSIKSKPIASGYNFYMLFWVFVLFSIMGYMFESFANLIQIYGLGAIIIIEITRWLKNKNILFLYVFCCVFGGFFEYIFSYVEEMLLHSTAWDYSTMPFNIGGRTNLLFSLVWGFVGVAIVKVLFPLTKKLIVKIRGKGGVVFTWIVLVVLLGDMILSSAMVYRAYERYIHIPAHNGIDVLLDRYYPDAIVKKTYPSLKFK
jgi:uncharacterized membrane protein